jgi:CDGSH-type Zn-finger protein
MDEICTCGKSKKMPKCTCGKSKKMPKCDGTCAKNKGK